MTDHTPSGLPQPQTVALRVAAERVLEMCYSIGDFRNGVTDPNGTIDEGEVRAGELLEDLRRALSAPAVETVAVQEAPEVLFEQYVADLISNAPEPLRELGDYLSRVLDEDEWPTAERYVLAAMRAAPLPVAPKAEQAATQAEAKGATVADRLDEMADAQPAGSQASSDLYAAATIWRKHIAHRAAPTGAQAEAKDDGFCRSCTPDGGCVTGPECVTLGRDDQPGGRS